jgi:FdhE protein
VDSKASAPGLPEALGELDKLSRTRPALQVPAAVLREVLPALFGEVLPESPVPLSSGAARDKLAEGVPLLRGQAPPLDGAKFRQRWLAVCAAVERHEGGGPARAVAEAVRGGGLDPAALLGEVLAAGAEGVHARAEALGLDAALTATVLRLSALPALARVAAALAPLRQQASWDAGYCPTCGSWPLLGELRGLEQTRFLRCGLCGTGWELPRLRCPFCDTQDHRQLLFLHAETDKDRYRAAACENCRGYVKIVSTLLAPPEPLLLVLDLATLHLDLVAAQRGFLVP